MALTITPRDIKYLRCQLKITSEDFMKLYECAPKMTMWQRNYHKRYGNWSSYPIRKSAVLNICLLTKEAFWKTAIQAAYNGEAQAKTGYDEYEHILFRVVERA